MVLYMDAHVPFAITAGLRLRGVDVLTAQEDDAAGWTTKCCLIELQLSGASSSLVI